MDPQEIGAGRQKERFQEFRKRLLNEAPDELATLEIALRAQKVFGNNFRLYGKQPRELFRLGVGFLNRTIVEAKYDGVARAVASRTLKLTNLMVAAHSKWWVPALLFCLLVFSALFFALTFY